MAETGLAILAKAPIPGFAKTRLAPFLGAAGTARLQEQLIRQAVRTGLASGLDPVTLWCAPDCVHPLFPELGAAGISLMKQPGGDLGRRMLAVFEAGPLPLVLIGADCPSLTGNDLAQAAAALRDGADLVLAPAEDGGYGLIGLARPCPILFSDMPWSTDRVFTLTRQRGEAAGLAVALIRRIWDVDTAADYQRLVASGLLP